MKFLVLGCNGMAGHTISLYLKEQGHEVFGFDRMKSTYVDSVAGDARDLLALEKLIKEGHYDSVVNCIGILNHFAEANKALAAFLNSYFPHFLADATSGTDTQVIHMSTDCVFSGKRGEYTEEDFRDGETFYDRSKALGELEDGKNITFASGITGENGVVNFNQDITVEDTTTYYTGNVTLNADFEAQTLNLYNGNALWIHCFHISAWQPSYPDSVRH